MSKRSRGSVWAALGVVAVVGCGAEPPPSQTPRAREPRFATGETPSAGTGVDHAVRGASLGADAIEEPAVAAGMATVITTRDGAYAASDPDRDSLWLARETASSVRRVRFERGAQPSRIAEDSEGTLHVVLRGAGAIAHVDAASGVELARTAVCANPRGVAAWPGTSKLFVACEDGTLARFDWRASDRALFTRTFERDLRDVVVSGGSLWASTFRTAHVRRLSDELELLETFVLPSREIIATTGALWRPSVAWRMIATSAGGVAVALQYADSSELPTMAPLMESGPVYYRTGPAQCGALVNSVIAVLNKGEPPRLSGAIPGLSLVVDISERIAEGQPAIAGISVTNAIATQMANPPSVVAVGHVSMRSIEYSVTPRIGCSSVTDVVRSVRGEGVALTTTAGGELAVLLRQPAGLFFRHLGHTGIVVPFGGAESRQNTGYQVFHGVHPDGRAAPLACASCHPEGLDDGLVWRFSTGARRTQSLVSTLAGTAPYHWDGDLNTAGALLREVWTRRMAMPALSTAQTSAVTRWLVGLPNARPEPESKPESVARGRVLFESSAVQCASCHSGAMLTNNETMDVGTQGRFQVPSLRGLRRRAPLMHDGCAATLLDRFTDERCGGGDRHGHTSQLDQEQLADLVAYLETL